MSVKNHQFDQPALPDVVVEKIKKANPRSQARALAVQALYQWLVSQDPFQDLLTHYEPQLVSADVDASYFRAIVREVVTQKDRWDKQIIPLVDRPYKNMEILVRVILYIGVYELNERPDVPYKVILNEAVEMTKVFGSEASFKYINAILDRLSLKLRAVERSVKAETLQKSP